MALPPASVSATEIVPRTGGRCPRRRPGVRHRVDGPVVGAGNGDGHRERVGPRPARAGVAQIVGGDRERCVAIEVRGRGVGHGHESGGDGREGAPEGHGRVDSAIARAGAVRVAECKSESCGGREADGAVRRGQGQLILAPAEVHVGHRDAGRTGERQGCLLDGAGGGRARDIGGIVDGGDGEADRGRRRCEWPVIDREREAVGAAEVHGRRVVDGRAAGARGRAVHRSLVGAGCRPGRWCPRSGRSARRRPGRSPRA